MPSERHRIPVYLNDAEKARVDELSAQFRLSRSEMFKRLALGYRMPRADEFEAWNAIRDLLKVNADQARLGNLVKMIADDLPDDVAQRFEELRTNIVETQNELKTVVHEIRASIPGR